MWSPACCLWGQSGEVSAQAQNKTCLKVTQRDLSAILISGLNLVDSFFSYPVLIETTTSINTGKKKIKFARRQFSHF